MVRRAFVWSRPLRLTRSAKFPLFVSPLHIWFTVFILMLCTGMNALQCEEAIFIYTHKQITASWLYWLYGALRQKCLWIHKHIVGRPRQHFPPSAAPLEPRRRVVCSVQHLPAGQGCLFWGFFFPACCLLAEPQNNTCLPVTDERKGVCDGNLSWRQLLLSLYLQILKN